MGGSGVEGDLSPLQMGLKREGGGVGGLPLQAIKVMKLRKRAQRAILKEKDLRSPEMEGFLFNPHSDLSGLIDLGFSLSPSEKEDERIISNMLVLAQLPHTKVSQSYLGGEGVSPSGEWVQKFFGYKLQCDILGVPPNSPAYETLGVSPKNHEFWIRELNTRELYAGRLYYLFSLVLSGEFNYIKSPDNTKKPFVICSVIFFLLHSRDETSSFPDQIMLRICQLAYGIPTSQALISKEKYVFRRARYFFPPLLSFHPISSSSLLLPSPNLHLSRPVSTFFFLSVCFFFGRPSPLSFVFFLFFSFPLFPSYTLFIFFPPFISLAEFTLHHLFFSYFIVFHKRK